MLGIFKTIFGRNPDDQNSEESAAKHRLQKLRDKRLSTPHTPHTNDADDAAASFRDLVQAKTHEPGTSPFSVWSGLEGKAHSVGLAHKGMVSPHKGGAFGFSENPMEDDIETFARESFAESSAKKKLQSELRNSVLASLLTKHGQIERNLDPEPGTSGQYDVIKDTVLADAWSAEESLFGGTGLFCDYSETLHLAAPAAEEAEKPKCFGPPVDLNKLEKPKAKQAAPTIDDDDFVDEVLYHYDNPESLFDEPEEEEEYDDDEVGRLAPLAPSAASPVSVAAPAEASAPPPLQATVTSKPTKQAPTPPKPKSSDAAEVEAQAKSEGSALPAPAATVATSVTPNPATPTVQSTSADAAKIPPASTAVKVQTAAKPPAQAKPDAQSQAKLSAQAKPQSQSQAKLPAQAKPQSQSQAKLPAQAKPHSQSQSRLQAQAKPQSQSYNRLQAQPKNLQLSDLCDSIEIKQFSHPYDKFSEASLKLIAQNPKTPSGALSWLAAHRNPHIRAAVAKNPTTPIETFWVLARDHESSIRYSIAENLYMSPEILRELSRDRNPLIATTAQNALHSVRESLMNALPPSSLYSKKASTTGQSMEAAKKPESAEPAAEATAQQQGDEEFLLMISRKPATPARRLKELANHPSGAIRAAVAENGNTPVDILWLMARDADPNVKIKLAQNCNLPEEILDILKEDKDSFVSKAAVKVQSKLAGLRFTGEAGGNDIRHVLTWP